MLNSRGIQFQQQSPALAVGDKVTHPIYGPGEIFEISETLGFADINLDEAFTDAKGKQRDTVIVPIAEIHRQLPFMSWLILKGNPDVSIEENTKKYNAEQGIKVVFRPKTRGELFNKLKEGISCEVVASNEEITTICLLSINIMGHHNVKFKTVPSKNAGWVIYEAI